MAKLSELIMHMKQMMDKLGDIQVVYKFPDDSIKDILSCGVSKAYNVKDEDIAVYWMSGEFVNQPVDTSEPQAKFTED